MINIRDYIVIIDIVDKSNLQQNPVAQKQLREDYIKYVNSCISTTVINFHHDGIRVIDTNVFYHDSLFDSDNFEEMIKSLKKPILLITDSKFLPCINNFDWDDIHKLCHEDSISMQIQSDFTVFADSKNQKIDDYLATLTLDLVPEDDCELEFYEVIHKIYEDFENSNTTSKETHNSTVVKQTTVTSLDILDDDLLLL